MQPVEIKYTEIVTNGKIADEDILHSTLATNFRKTVAKTPNADFLGERSFLPGGTRGPYVFMNYQSAATRVTNFGSGLHALGLAPGAHCALMSKNRIEWMLTDLACFCYNFPSIPIYDSYGANDCEYILAHSDSQVIVAAPEHLPFINRTRPNCPALRFIVVMDDRPADKEYAATHRDEFTHTMSEVEALGAQTPLPDEPVTRDHIATLVYTSGTSGSPKGAILTHKNILSGAYALGERLTYVPFQDVHIGYLPLAHIFERVVEHLMISRGNAIGYFQGDPNKLIEDIQALRPTMLPGVPRVFNKTCAALKAATQKSFFLKRWIFNYAYTVKNKAVDKGEATPKADRLVFNKIKERFGGRVRVLFSGSAPLAADVARFLRVCMNVPLVEGYALTETSSAGAVTTLENTEYGNVGVPLRTIEIKLGDIPEMDYSVTDNPPRGEILIRGPAVFQGYYKDPATTAQVLVDGWVRTGDVGTWLPGPIGPRLKIIDRVKNIFKLSQGEFVCSERIEATYGTCPMVSQIMIHGERTMNGLVALVAPNFDALGQWANTHGLGAIAGDKAALCAHPNAKRAVLDALVRQGQSAQLRRFEILQDILLLPREFSTENQMLTPSFKLRRDAIRRGYKAELEAMCGGLRQNPAREPPQMHL